MSEPAKSAEEIEDVLASIRRLVSGPLVSVPADAMGPTDTPSAERLVLTAALRVMDPDDPWAPVTHAAPKPEPQDRAPQAADEDQQPVDASDPAWGLEDRLADWGEISESAEEAVLDALSDGPEAARTEQPATITFSRAKAMRPVPAQTPTPSLSDFEPEAGDTDWPDAVADSVLRKLVMARAQPATDAQSPPDMSIEDAAPDQSSGAPPETAPETGGEAVLNSDADAPTTSKGLTAYDADDLADTAIADDFGDDRDDFGDDTDDAYEDEIEDLGQASPPLGFPNADVGVLDEETLREIVAEVVRQELQGALGQRITRNVRKMVRREIRLALAADELD